MVFLVSVGGREQEGQKNVSLVSQWLIPCDCFLVFFTVRIQASAGDWEEEAWRKWAKPSSRWVNTHTGPQRTFKRFFSTGFSDVIRSVQSPFSHWLFCMCCPQFWNLCSWALQVPQVAASVAGRCLSSRQHLLWYVPSFLFCLLSLIP